MVSFNGRNVALFGGNKKEDALIGSAAINFAQQSKQEETNMDFATFAFENRTMRETVRKPSLGLSKEQILAKNVVDVLERMFRDGSIRLTTSPNTTRKNGLHVLYTNRIQWDQTCRALAYAEHNVFAAWQMFDSENIKNYALFDAVGEQSRIVEEFVTPEGYVNHRVFNAHVGYNAFGQGAMGLVNDGTNPINEWLRKQTDEHNQWAAKFNAAVLAVCQGTSEYVDANGVINRSNVHPTDEQVDMVRRYGRKLDSGDWNQVKRDNWKFAIKAESIVDKYALTAHIMLDQKPAFEIFTFAKTAQATDSFLRGLAERGNRSYHSQLAILSGVSLATEPVAE